MLILKVGEWQSASGRWYVADVHTWTGWRDLARILDVEEDVEVFSEYLRTKRAAIVVSYTPEKDFLMFYWPSINYKNAHQFKLDVNRIARKKNYLV